MHEYHLIEGAVKNLKRMFNDAGAKKLRKVNINLGEHSEYSPEALKEIFGELTKGTELEGGELVVKKIHGSREIKLVSMEVD